MTEDGSFTIPLYLRDTEIVSVIHKKVVCHMNRLNVKDLQNYEIANITFNEEERDYIESLVSSPRVKNRKLAIDYIDTSSNVQKNLDFILKMADRLIPDRNNSIRWRTFLLVGEYIRDFPSKVWPFIVKYGAVPNKDIRNGVASCLLEHILEYHYDKYLPEVEKLLFSNKNYIYIFKGSFFFGDEEFRQEFESRKTALIEKALKYWRSANRLKLKSQN